MPPHLARHHARLGDLLGKLVERAGGVRRGAAGHLRRNSLSGTLSATPGCSLGTNCVATRLWPTCSNSVAPGPSCAFRDNRLPQALPWKLKHRSPCCLASAHSMKGTSASALQELRSTQSLGGSIKVDKVDGVAKGRELLAGGETQPRKVSPQLVV